MLIPAEVDGTEEEGFSGGSSLTATVASNLPPAPPAADGITRMRWQWTTCTKARTQGNSALSLWRAGMTLATHDQELFLALRDWEPFFTDTMDDDDDDTHRGGSFPEKPAILNTDPNGLEVGSMTYSINDKALGSGDPIRVREGQRLPHSLSQRECD